MGWREPDYSQSTESWQCAFATLYPVFTHIRPSIWSLLHSRYMVKILYTVDIFENASCLMSLDDDMLYTVGSIVLCNNV